MRSPRPVLKGRNIVRSNLNHQTAMRLFAFTFLLAVLQHSAAAQQKSQPGSGAQASARFRITLNGFAVLNQSDDDILEGDGKGDEVYIRVDTWKLHRNRLVTDRQNLKTKIIGDVGDNLYPRDNPPRIKFGSAGDNGGLRSGDKFPNEQPWERKSAFKTDQPPMLLWEGELTRGEDQMVIAPTIWEWDGKDVSDSQTQWETQMEGDINCMSQFASTYQIPQGSKDTRASCIPSMDLKGSGGTRPIGLHSYNGFTPLFIALTYDAALEVTKTSPGNAGLGVIAVNYKDETAHGNYTLYIQVEKVN
jgi:hypothetical protein